MEREVGVAVVAVVAIDSGTLHSGVGCGSSGMGGVRE